MADTARFGIDPYLEWIEAEGIPVVEDYGVDLFAVETKPWARFGAKGAAVHLKGRGDFASMFVFELAPAAGSAPQRHLYEEVYYVLEGSGSTQLELADGTKRSFEWGPKSLFAIPLNAKYRHFNGSGRERALLVSTNNLPLVLNTFHNDKFIFSSDFDFQRQGKEEFFSGDGELIVKGPGTHTWETNFIPDIASLELKAWADRGAGSSNIVLSLADGLMHAHISEMPVGTYKKAHRHPPGFHVMCVNGTGYSLMWFEGEKDFIRLDWKHGVVFPPADRQFHQHFNSGASPARYLATGVGSRRYPFTTARRVSVKPGADGRIPVSISIKDGGDQMEYEDQDPRIQQIWVEETRKNGVDQQMDKFFPEGK